MQAVKAILFDTFGTIVDWRSSLIAELTAWGAERGVVVDWTSLVDGWRAAYKPSMDRVRNGDLPWTILDDLHRQALDVLLDKHGLYGLPEADRVYLTHAWHRLHPWPDAISGMLRLKRRYILAPLSNGNVSLLVNMAKNAGIPWDLIFGSDIPRAYKPDSKVYLGAVEMLGLQPGEVMMAAAHNYDLKAARALGLRTAFIARRTEYGPDQTTDLVADSDWDVVANSVVDLAEKLNC